jgi:hypothetical protein
MSPLRIAIACTAILMSVAAGCGGDSSSTGAEPSGRPVDVWARDFCTAFVAWQDGLGARQDEFQQALAAQASDPGFLKLRRLLVELMDDYIALTDEAAESIRAAGDPAVENGGQISSAIAGVVDEASVVLVGIREKARDLPVDDPDRFVEGAKELALSAQTQFQTTFSQETIADRLPDSAPTDLRDAVEDEPACEVFTGG